MELLVDTTSVGLELVSGVHTAGDWSVLVDLSLHLFLTREAVVVLGIVALVLDSPTFVLAGLANWAWWPGAILALIDGFAAVRLWIVGNVLLAGGVWDSLIIGELVDATWVSTLTASTST